MTTTNIRFFENPLVKYVNINDVEVRHRIMYCTTLQFLKNEEQPISNTNLITRRVYLLFHPDCDIHVNRCIDEYTNPANPFESLNDLDGSNLIQTLSNNGGKVSCILVNTPYILLTINGIYYVINLDINHSPEITTYMKTTLAKSCTADFVNIMDIGDNNEKYEFTEQMNSLLGSERNSQRQIMFMNPDYISMLDLHNAKNALQNMQINETDYFQKNDFGIAIDYMFQLKPNTIVTTYGNCVANPLIIGAFKKMRNGDNMYISSIELVPELKNNSYECVINSKTDKNYEGKKINKLLRAAVLLISPHLNTSKIVSFSVSPVSAWLMAQSFKSSVLVNDKNDPSITIPVELPNPLTMEWIEMMFNENDEFLTCEVTINDYSNHVANHVMSIIKGIYSPNGVFTFEINIRDADGNPIDADHTQPKRMRRIAKFVRSVVRFRDIGRARRSASNLTLENGDTPNPKRTKTIGGNKYRRTKRTFRKNRRTKRMLKRSRRK